MITIRKTFKLLTLLFFGIILVYLTIGQLIPIEYSNYKNGESFQGIIILGLPIAIITTLVWTIKKERSLWSNIVLGVITPIIAFLVFALSVGLIIYFEVGTWLDEEIIYENKDNPKKTINRQAMDLGQFGCGGVRIVKLTPIFGPWNIVSEIDTALINKSEWNLVQRPGGYSKGF